MESRVTQPESRPVTPSIGELCVAGDWACTHADVTALENVARRLAAHLGGPVRRDLEDVVELCRVDPAAAFEAWMLVKDRIWGADP